MVGTPSDAHSRDPLALPTLRFANLYGLRGEADHVDAVGAAADRQPPEIADREWRHGCEPLHRGAGGEKAAVDVAAELFEPCGGIHDIAVEDDGALEVADLADDDRPEMQAAAYPRHHSEFALQLARRARQFIAHCRKTSQRTGIDRTTALRPG